MLAFRALRVPILPQLSLQCSRRLSTQGGLPASIPTNALVQLPRSIIAVYGRDSSKYLNGLITIRPPEPRPDLGQPQAGAYAAMLNAKGRVITDAFVYAAHDNHEVQAATGSDGAFCYLLEVDSTLVDKIMDVLDFHVLMSDVNIKVLDSFHVWSAWNDLEDAAPASFGENNICINDSRAPGFGFRIVGPDVDGFKGEQAGVDEYNLRRYLCGIPEGPAELIPGKALPLDACIDYMGGIDFNKGCYMGQELTIRTHHHGAVRKRIAPIVLTRRRDEPIPEDVYKPQEFAIAAGSSITDASPVPNARMVTPIFGESPFKSSASGAAARLRPAGTIVATLGNVGLAMIRLDKIGHAFRVKNYHLKALTPYWWPANAGPEAADSAHENQAQPS